MSDVFISYARTSGTATATAVSEALRALGYSVWRDDALPSHRPYSEGLEEQLAQAKAVLVLGVGSWRRRHADHHAIHLALNTLAHALAREPAKPLPAKSAERAR